MSNPIWKPTLPPIHNSGSDYYSTDQQDYFPFVLSHGGLKFAIIKLDNKTLQLHRTSWACPNWIQYASDAYYSKFRGSSGYGVGANSGFGNSTTDPCTNGSSGGNYWANDQSGTSNGCPTGITGPSVNSMSNWGTGACVPNLSYMPDFESTPCTPLGGWLTMADCVRGATHGNSPTQTGSGNNDQGTAVDALYWNLCTPNDDGCDCSGGQIGAYKYASSGNGLHANGAWHSPQANGIKIANQGKGRYNDTMYYHGLLSNVAWPASTAAYPGYSNKSFYAVGRAMDDIVQGDPVSGSYNNAGAFIGYKSPDYVEVTNTTNNSALNYGVNFPTLVTNDGIAPVNNLANQFSDLKSNLIYQVPPQHVYNNPAVPFIAGVTAMGTTTDHPNVWPQGGTDCMSYYAIVIFPTTTAQKANAFNEYNGLDFKLHLDIMSSGYQKIMGERYQFNTTGGPSGDGKNYSGIQGSCCYNVQVGLNWMFMCNQGEDDHPLAQSNTGIQHQTTDSYLEEMDANGTPTVNQNFTAGICDLDAQSIGGILDGEFVGLDSKWWLSGNQTSSAYRNPWDRELLNNLQKHIIKEVAYAGYPDELTPSYADMDRTILVVKTPAVAPHWRVLAAGCQTAIDPEFDNLYFNLHVTGPTGSGTKTVMFRDVVTGFQDEGNEVRSLSEWAQTTLFTGHTYGSYSFPWQGNGVLERGHGIGFNADIWGTTTLAGEPYHLSGDWKVEWDLDYTADTIGRITDSNFKVFPLQYTGFDFYLGDAVSKGAGGPGVPEKGQFSTTNSVQHSYANNTGSHQGVWYDYDARIEFDETKAAYSSYTTQAHDHFNTTGRPYSPFYLNSAGHCNFINSGYRHEFLAMNDTTGNTTSQYILSAVTFYSSTRINTLNQAWGYRDDSAHIRFLGVWKVWEGVKGSSSYTAGTVGLTNPADRFAPVLGHVDNVNHSDGVIHWGDPALYSDYYHWGDGGSNYNFGFNSLQTTAGAPPYTGFDKTLNNWALQTGNGMIYNGNYMPDCAHQMYTSVPPITCGNTGSLIITMAGGYAPWETFKIIEDSTGTPIHIGSHGSGTYEYAASGSNTFDLSAGTYPVTSGFNNNVYTITELPVGTYTIVATTPFAYGGCDFGTTITVTPPAVDITYDYLSGQYVAVSNACLNNLVTPPCNTFASALYEFTATKSRSG